jgi:hypothetical protein
LRVAAGGNGGAATRGAYGGGGARAANNLRVDHRQLAFGLAQSIGGGAVVWVCGNGGALLGAAGFEFGFKSV